MRTVEVPLSHRLGVGDVENEFGGQCFGAYFIEVVGPHQSMGRQRGKESVLAP